MDGDSAPQRSRSVTSVDLGAMKSRVAELSASAGVGTSTWLRDLVHRELSRSAAADGGQGAAGTTQAAGVFDADDDIHPGPYRTWLDAALTAKLDRLTEANGFRTRPATLRALIEGVRIGDGSDGAGGARASDAIRALGFSNHHLVAIGRNVNQIAKALHASGKTTTADRLALDEAVRVIHEHVAIASALVGELRPMFKREKA